MIQTLKAYWSWMQKAVKRRWMRIKRYDYSRIGAGALRVMDSLPGIIAWGLEVCAIAASVGFVLQAARAVFQGKLWNAAVLIGLAGMLIGLAILTDYYTGSGHQKANDNA